MKRPSREASQRQRRVGEAIRHALAEVFLRGDLRDPDLAGRSITVTEVVPTPDLRNATVFVMPLGGGDPASLIEGLARSAPHLAAEVGRRVYLRYTPRLRFRLDETFDYADRIETLLRSADVSRDLHHRPDDDPDDPAETAPSSLEDGPDRR
jgi:ribosome-binding factor A